MNLSTFIVLGIVVLICALIIANYFVQKKKGKTTCNCGCGSTCSGCSGCTACHQKVVVQK